MAFKYVTALIGIVLMIMAYTHPANESSRAHNIRRIVCIVLGILFLFFTFHGIYSDGKKEDEVTRLAKINEKKADSLARDNEKWKNEVLLLATGGNSFPIGLFHQDLCTKNRQSLVIFNKGGYPIEDLKIHYCDVDAFNEKYLKKKLSLNEWFLYSSNVGTIYPNGYTMPPSDIAVSYVNDKSERNFILTMYTKNKGFLQSVKYRIKNGKLFFASKIDQINLATGKADRVIFDTLYPGFLNAGERRCDINWVYYDQRLLDSARKTN